MATRTLGISEARRLLPGLVRSVARDGGRVEITYRGKPEVVLLRVSDVKGRRAAQPSPLVMDPALRVVVSVPGGDLVGAIRELRATQGHARTSWLPEERSPRRARKTRTKRPRSGR